MDKKQNSNLCKYVLIHTLSLLPIPFYAGIDIHPFSSLFPFTTLIFTIVFTKKKQRWENWLPFFHWILFTMLVFVAREWPLMWPLQTFLPQNHTHFNTSSFNTISLKYHSINQNSMKLYKLSRFAYFKQLLWKTVYQFHY